MARGGLSGYVAQGVGRSRLSADCLHVARVAKTGGDAGASDAEEGSAKGESRPRVVEARQGEQRRTGMGEGEGGREEDWKAPPGAAAPRDALGRLLGGEQVCCELVGAARSGDGGGGAPVRAKVARVDRGVPYERLRELELHRKAQRGRAALGSTLSIHLAVKQWRELLRWGRGCVQACGDRRRDEASRARRVGRRAVERDRAAARSGGRSEEGVQRRAAARPAAGA